MVAHNYYDSSRVSRCSSSPREGQPEFTWPTPERGSKSAAPKENLQSTRQKAKLSRIVVTDLSPVFGLLRARNIWNNVHSLFFLFRLSHFRFGFFFSWIIHFTFDSCHFVRIATTINGSVIIFIGIKIEEAKWNFKCTFRKNIISDPRNIRNIFKVYVKCNVRKIKRCKIWKFWNFRI